MNQVTPPRVMRSTSEELPTCFGKEWDKNAPECAGGADSDFTHPKNGLHVRDQCNFFQSCGVRLQAVRSAQVIPASQLFRPPVVTAPPQQPHQTFQDFLRAQAATHIEKERQAAMAGVRPPTPTLQPWQQQPGVHHPAPSYQLNYQMPGYLSMPEERMPGETIWAPLLREVFRSMLKAIGHAVSHFFDVRPLKEK